MAIRIRTVALADESLLLPLMRAYYVDDGLTFGPDNAAALRRLLSEPQWGRVWFVEAQARIGGYVVLCLGFSLELGGNDAYVDELYVEPAARGQGIARTAMALVLDEARLLGVRAVHLEVDQSNERAVGLYASLGFEARDRYYLMTRQLRS